MLFDPYALELSHDKDGAALRAAGEDPALFGARSMVMLAATH